jgi:hypothetical protein
MLYSKAGEMPAGGRRARGWKQSYAFEANCTGHETQSDFLMRQPLAEKQKSGYTLPHDQSRLPHRPEPELPSGAVPTKGEPREKSLRPMPRNPLISLDSDERIQANPRQSNPHERGPSQRKAVDPRKPKTAGDRPPKARDPLHPNATRFSAYERLLAVCAGSYAVPECLRNLPKRRQNGWYWNIQVSVRVSPPDLRNARSSTGSDPSTRRSNCARQWPATPSGTASMSW